MINKIVDYLNINEKKVEKQQALKTILELSSKFKVNRECAKKAYYKWKRQYIKAECIPNSKIEVDEDYFIKGVWTADEDLYLLKHKADSIYSLSKKLKRSETQISGRLDSFARLKKIENEKIMADINESEREIVYKLRTKGTSFFNISKIVGKPKESCSVVYLDIITTKLRKGEL